MTGARRSTDPILLDRRARNTEAEEGIAARETELTELKRQLTTARLTQAEADRRVLNLTNSLIDLIERGPQS